MGVIANNGAKFSSECFLSTFFQTALTSEGGERSNNGWKCRVEVIKRSSTRSSPWISLDCWQPLSSFTPSITNTTTNTATNTPFAPQARPARCDHCNTVTCAELHGSFTRRFTGTDEAKRVFVGFTSFVLYPTSTFYRCYALFIQDQELLISNWVQSNWGISDPLLASQTIYSPTLHFGRRAQVIYQRYISDDEYQH